MSQAKPIKDVVRKKYAALAQGAASPCCAKDPCCGDATSDISTGYSREELSRIPQKANLGLGCGNPIAQAGIHSGEIVVDLGSGAGIDCFLAAQRVGERGYVIGIDMTEAMLDRARENARSGGYTNVEFRLGEIEDIPVDPGSIDLVISNCVINLAPDKERVFREIYRILRPGGRFCVSDVVAKGTIPADVRADMEKWAGCIAGALDKQEYLDIVRRVGFGDITIKSEVDYDYQKSDGYSLASITLLARKPNGFAG
ncbi:MAG: arsenite methyltransferase [Candidatus Zixiibacteriota bacterium]